MKRRVLLSGIVACVIGLAVLVWTSSTRSRDGSDPTQVVHPRDVRAPLGLPNAPRAPMHDAERPGLRLEGLVVGPDDEPVGGARVWIAGMPAPSVLTGEDGTFALDGLAPGGYRVVARHHERIGGPRPIRVDERTEPVVIRLAPGVAVEVTVVDEASRPIPDAEVRVLGEPLTARTDAAGTAGLRGLSPGWIDLEARAPGFAPGRLTTAVELVGAPARVTITLETGVPVAGRVRDERGSGIAGVRVYAVRGSDYLDDQAAEAAVTVADGAFVIPAVAPGAYWFAFVDDAHVPSRTPRMLIEHPVSGLDVVMQPGGLVAGTVVDSDGRPAPHATVRVAAERNDTGLLRPRQTISGADGTYELRGLSRAQYSLRAESDAGVSAPRDVDLAASGPALRDQELVLEATRSISGVVVDERGDPVPDVLVQAEEEVTAHAVASSATTDDRGAFSIEGLSPGEYALAAGHSEALRRSVYAKAGDRDVRVVYSRAGAITGTLVLADSGVAPSRFRLRLQPRGSGPMFTPGGTDGTFALHEVPPGTYTLSFWGPELVETHTPSFEVRPGETTDLGTVRVQRGRTISGKVVDARGRPVAGAKVLLGRVPLVDRFPYDDSLEVLRSTFSDASGAFSILGLSEETIHVSIGAKHPVHGRSLAIDVPGGSANPRPVTLVLRGVGSLAGTIFQNGQPVSHAIVGAGDPEIAATTADDRGAFVLPTVPEGPLVLRISQAGLHAHTHTVQVVAGTQTHVTIDVPVDSVSLAVAVHREAGTSFPLAHLVLFHGDVTFSNRRELMSRYGSGGGRGFKVWRDAATRPLRFDELVPGHHTLCAVPLEGDPFSDPELRRRIDAQSESIAVHCAPISVAPTPAEQAITIEIPSMSVLSTR